MTRDFTEDEIRTLRDMKACKPFRDWFAGIDPDGACEYWSGFNKRRATKRANEGWRVLAILLPRRGRK